MPKIGRKGERHEGNCVPLLFSLLPVGLPFSGTLVFLFAHSSYAHFSQRCFLAYGTVASFDRYTIKFINQTRSRDESYFKMNCSKLFTNISKFSKFGLQEFASDYLDCGLPFSRKNYSSPKSSAISPNLI